jgi:teichuronic acid biosynthesis glycosyltransferase TuaG
MATNSNYTLVSVIIPAYNASKFIKETILSVINQTHNDPEIIVVDDGSSDNTISIVEKLQYKFKRITLIKKQNGGVSSARNAGFKFSHGRFIAFLDADDIWEPDFLEIAVEALAKQKGDIFVSVSRRFAITPNDSGKIHGPNHRFVKHFPKTIIENNPIVPAMVLLQRHAVDKVGAFGNDLTCWEDWDYWLRCVKHGLKFVFYIERPLVHYRETANSRSSDQFHGFLRCAETLKGREINGLATPFFVRKMRAKWLRRRGKIENHKGKALNYIGQAFLLAPWDLSNAAWYLIRLIKG